MCPAATRPTRVAAGASIGRETFPAPSGLPRTTEGPAR